MSMDNKINNYREIKYFDFDLEKKPSDRWEEIFNEFSLKIGDIRKQLKSIIKQYGALIPISGGIFNTIDPSNIMFYDELAFIADRMKMPLYQIVILQLIYEMTSACTTAIFKIGKEEYFLRTMDWPMPFLKDITIGLNIKKGSKEISKVIGWIGCVGFFTVINPDYKIAINYRRTCEINIESMIMNTLRTFGMKWPISYLVRYIVEKELILPDIITVFEKAELISPTYITIYSINNSNKSVIITRDNNKLVNTRSTDLIQTNCDHDKLGPDILWSLERRELLNMIINELNEQKKCSKKLVIKNLLIAPIVNSETIYIYFSKGKKSISIV